MGAGMGSSITITMMPVRNCSPTWAQRHPGRVAIREQKMCSVKVTLKAGYSVLLLLLLQ